MTSDYNHDDDTDGPDALEFRRYENSSVRCRNCGKQVYDELEECPFCHFDLAAKPGRPRWLIWTAMAMLLLFAYAVLNGLGLL